MASNTTFKAGATGGAAASDAPLTPKKSKGKRVFACLGTVNTKTKSISTGTEVGDKAVIIKVDPEVAKILDMKKPTDAEVANTVSTSGRGSNRGTKHGRTVVIQRPGTGVGTVKAQYVQFPVPSNIPTKTLGALLGKFLPASIDTARIKGGYDFPITR